MFAHEAAVPLASHFCHWYVKIGFEPVQSPGRAVSVPPTTGVPEIVGGRTFFGAAAPTTGVGSDVPGAEPSGVVAVTVTRTVLPTSPEASLYVPAVLPAMFVHPPPPEPQRFH